MMLKNVSAHLRLHNEEHRHAYLAIFCVCRGATMGVLTFRISHHHPEPIRRTQPSPKRDRIMYCNFEQYMRMHDPAEQPFACYKSNACLSRTAEHV